MNNNPNEDPIDIPASMRRGKKEISKIIGLRIPLSWWYELSQLAKEYDQDVSTFIREAVGEWLQRARKVRQMDKSGR